MMRFSCCLILMLAVCVQVHAQEPVRVTVSDDVLATIGPNFHCIHYDGPEHGTSNSITHNLMHMHGAFGSPSARKLLQDVGFRIARIFVWQAQVRPDADTWDWANTDASVQQVLDSGMVPMLCLNQAGPQWMDGTDEKPWWKTAQGRGDWASFARTLAERYKGKCAHFEVFNEPNIIKSERPDCFGWDGIVDTYIAAADAIKQVSPDATCGGAATWAAWETAEFGKAVLKRPEGERLLDFVSYHIYTSHDLDDANDALFVKAAWFRETPAYIREQLAQVTDKRILIACTEYNSSAVCSKDGKPYTDPRNVDAFGGVLAASVLCNSAQSGADMVFRFATIGGFGIIVWPPEFQPRACYFAYALLSRVAGLVPGSRVLKVSNSLPGQESNSAVRGTLTDRPLDAFAIEREDGRRAVVLIHKRAATTYTVSAELGEGVARAELYRFSARRIPDAVYPIGTLSVDGGAFPVECEPYTVTVLLATQ